MLLFGLAACGRLDFAEHVDASGDASSDTPSAVGHDEDGDGIPDSIDPCPHVAIGGMTDTDGDGVGDACDPNPTTPTEFWVRFATMQAGDTAFDDVSGALQEADSIRWVGSVSPVMTINLQKARIDIGWTANAVVGPAQHQVAFGVDNAAATEYYFNELNDNGMGFHDAAIVSYDNANGYRQLALMDPGAFHAGSGYSRYDVGITANANLETGWTGQLYDLTAATPGYIGGTDIRFAFNGLDLSIRYLAIIGSN